MRSSLYRGEKGTIPGTACWRAKQHNKVWLPQRIVVKLRVVPAVIRTEAGEVWRRSGCRSLCSPAMNVELILGPHGRKQQNYYVGGCNNEPLEDCCSKMGSLLNSDIKTIDNPASYGGR